MQRSSRSSTVASQPDHSPDHEPSDYGSPFDGIETGCDTMALRRIYVDPGGKMSLCCQLSDYGFNTRDLVGDLHTTTLRELFPCMRCARAQGKLDWLAQCPDNPWAAAMRDPALVSAAVA